MNTYAINGLETTLAEYETPFADVSIRREEEHATDGGGVISNQFFAELESPFSQSFEPVGEGGQANPNAGAFVQFLGELQDPEFTNTLYHLASELEDSWSNKITSEAAMGENFIPFATQEAFQYFAPLQSETEAAIDKVNQYFTGNTLAERTETEIDQFFTQLEYGANYTPAQEQFFKSILNKVKSVVKTGVNLAKKGISIVGKLVPLGPILNRLKGMIRPLLNKVLQFAIGKLPRNLQPFARNLAKQFLNMESTEGYSEQSENEGTGELEAIQTEFDTQLGELVFSGSETEAEQYVMNYENSSDTLAREESYETGGLQLPSLEAARQQFVDDLKNLKEGESAAPAIERFLPAVILALRPVIKMAISLIGRQKVINFLAGLLAKLVSRYVPQQVVMPLASNIIDVGMSAIGFETYETQRPDVGYEAIVNTIQETIQNMGQLNEDLLNDQEALTGEVLEAFETAAANNFPAQYIRKNLQPSAVQGIWVAKPRKGPKHLYKKYTHVFQITIHPKIAKAIKTFGSVPLFNFLRDRLGLDPSKPIQARVHLFEAISGTQLSDICRHEKKLPGLAVQYGYLQLQPLSVCTAAMLIKEPCLGKDVNPSFTKSYTRITPGQRFYYLEISGARLKVAPPAPKKTTPPPTPSKPGTPVIPPQPPVAQPSDIQGVINFLKAEVRLNYFFSEEEARGVVEKLNKGDYFGAGYSIRYSVRNVLHDILLKNVGSKVKIIHEAMPELYLDNYVVPQDQFLGALGKEAIGKAVGVLIEKVAEAAYQGVVNYFKARAAEFKEAQAQAADGVTVKIIYVNIPGMSKIAALINAFKGTFSVGNLLDLTLPSIPTPEVQVRPGKQFD